MQLTWLGQGGFLFEVNGCRLAVDPYLSNSLADRDFPRMIPPPIKPTALNADFIVCTHDHGDHFDPDTVLPAVAAQTETAVVGPASVVEHGSDLGLSVRQLDPDNTQCKLGPFVLRAVPAHHSDADAIGLIVEVEGQRVYVSGDTTYAESLAPNALSDGPIDLLLICINGKLGNMSAAEAVKVADTIRPRLAIPMHYGLFATNTADPETFLLPARASGLAARTLRPGQPVTLSALLDTASNALPFQGIIPPVVTPLNSDETLDEPAFRKLLSKLVDTDLAALFVCGTVGLGPALTDDVYSAVIKTAVDVVASRMPLLAGVLEPSTNRTIARLKLAESEGIGYAVVSAPYFFAPRSTNEFIAHFEACAKSTSLTIVAYNLPQYTRGAIPVDALLELWSKGLICAVKESSGDLDYFETLCRRAANEGLPVFQGNRPDFPRLVELNAAGAVPVPANIDPSLFARAWSAAVANHAESRELQKQTDALWNELVEGSDFMSGTLRRLAAEGIGQQHLPMPWMIV